MVRTREETRCKLDFYQIYTRQIILYPLKRILLWLTFKGIILKNILFDQFSFSIIPKSKKGNGTFEVKQQRSDLPAREEGGIGSDS